MRDGISRNCRLTYASLVPKGPSIDPAFWLARVTIGAVPMRNIGFAKSSSSSQEYIETAAHAPVVAKCIPSGCNTAVNDSERKSIE